ncbi:7-carboxy-7-deazaguanine synthase [Bacillus glycinifermentans]|uniref:7-carboxy-7-deazaguanine synthase n=1 Tax=Bacillus glycinifermentans TaxID=1664069 RepID=A0A0J6EN99_9BACI|nr:7-carboxy-7-deazaguanine synthase QueE [Bacillus glycinifermentans]ATH95301.1 7-carboxy-7-deazaguanine synthase QueE [Bacillus glycinifermentans]KMM58099.1 7-carboxy-7-deazaguanine synthase [Bacillus glycinifermentans]KRT91452.1 7-carboxy-7-deazaguanine synthase [Bacillus glycinifermentans]MEC0486976.1 7-carboxy-7-deazaguanine synthase QueE [Bacillus glycinifermentans]MEC0495298.1 7-carboxy-7-deazaguanine synthase QueE [Bacillus glycinifermentans]
MAKPIPVLEIFGPTIQGEGMVIGRKTMFVRTAGCDYSCSWCDSAFTWDGSAKKDIKWMTAEEVYRSLKEIGGDSFSHVTISGGNPALLKQLDGLISLLKEKNIRTALETQGTFYQDWFAKIDDLTISPKPPSSNMKTDFQKLDHIIGKLKGHGRLAAASLKVVIFTPEDLQFAKNVHQRYPEIPFYLQVGNEDVHTEEQERLVEKLLRKYEELVDAVTRDPELNRVRVLPQLHTLIWGNKRGV